MIKRKTVKTGLERSGGLVSQRHEACADMIVGGRGGSLSEREALPLTLFLDRPAALDSRLLLLELQSLAL